MKLFPAAAGSFALGFAMVAVTMPAFAQEHGIKEYVANMIVGDAPVMDGQWSEDEWAGSEFTSGMFGLNNQGSNGANQGQPVDVNYQWRALWDDDYLYVLIVAEMLDLPVNGVIGGEIVDTVVEGDDQVFSFAIGLGTDIEIFLEPNYQQGDGFNSNPPEFTENGSDPAVSDGYQFVWFPLENDLDFTPRNDGLRNADAPDGPPWFFTGGNYNSAFVGGEWNPVFDPAAASEFGALPFVAGTDLGLTGADRASGDVYAVCVMEVAMAFSQFNPDFGINPGTEEENNLTLVADADGAYVSPGDEWLINIAGYSDPARAAEGITLLTWNNVVGPQFASYPRGVLRFATDTRVEDWMLN